MPKERTTMKITVTKLTDATEVKRAMLATQGKKLKTTGISDDTMQVQLLGLHSTLEGYIFNVLIEGCKEREHTHIVRHEEIGKYVSTARPDWSDESTQDSRLILLRIPADRLIEICSRRLCGAAWKGTREIFYEIKKQVEKLDPLLWRYLTPPCSKTNYCTEVRACCGYIGSGRQEREYEYFKSESTRLVNKFQKEDQ